MGNWTNKEASTTPSNDGSFAPILPISLEELFISPPDFDTQSYSMVENTITDRIYVQFKERGFVAFSIPPVMEALCEQWRTVKASSAKFFEEHDIPTKKEQLDRFQGQNRGYINVQRTREYLKFRLTDVKELSELSNDKCDLFREREFLENFEALFEQLLNVVWQAFLHLYHASRIKFVGNGTPILSSEGLMDTHACVSERSYVSVIHYYPLSDEQIPDDSSPPDAIRFLMTPRKSEEELEQEKEGGNRRCVCSTHTDTGLLTAIFCSDEAGLEVLDKSSQCWIKAEDLLHKRSNEKSEDDATGYLIVIMGEKLPVFADSKELKPTRHRVMMEGPQERYSTLFFMDTAK